MRFTPTPKNKYKLELNAYFSSISDVLGKIDKFKENISKGKLSYNDGHDSFNILSTEEPNYRYEEINGQECIVYQSKMNFDEDI